jgi:hypothetical protein
MLVHFTQHPAKAGATGMNAMFHAPVTLVFLAAFVASAEAVIKVETATVQNGVAFIKGNGAEKGAQISWDGTAVTTANNKNGGFSFNGAVPTDCVGGLSDGTQTIQVDVLNCIPAAAAPPAPVPRTGQKTSFDTNSPKRDDGALQAGVEWPNPRFILNVNPTDDNGAGGGTAANGICDGTETCNGTVTDNLTGLIWLRNANCANSLRTWHTAKNDVVQLNTNGTMNSNNCGDTSNAGANQTDWRLPNIRELHSIVDFGTFNPALPSGHPFENFEGTYWSSTTVADDASLAWIMSLTFGRVDDQDKSGNSFNVTAVRGGL